MAQIGAGYIAGKFGKWLTPEEGVAEACVTAILTKRFERAGLPPFGTDYVDAIKQQLPVAVETCRREAIIGVAQVKANLIALSVEVDFDSPTLIKTTITVSPSRGGEPVTVTF